MAEIDLTQAEADALIAMAKYKVDDQLWDYPSLGGAINIPLVSIEKRALSARRASGSYQFVEGNISDPGTAGSGTGEALFRWGTPSQPQWREDYQSTPPHIS